MKAPLRLAAALVVVGIAGLFVLFILRGTSDEEARPDLQRIVAGLVTGRDGVAPGVTAYVSGPNGPWTGAAGVADPATHAPMPRNGRMRLESLSKLWTATVLLQLNQEGRLDLDAPLSRVLPGVLPTATADRITTRMLLHHTSGLVDDSDLLAAPRRAFARIPDPSTRARVRAAFARLEADRTSEFPVDLAIRVAAAQPLRSTPGKTYHYSNIGYMIAGLVAERAGDAPLAALYRRRIIDPLHLSSAAYDPHSRITGPHVRGWHVGDGGALTDATGVVGVLGANGGIVADAKDEATFVVALMDGRLLRPKQLTELQTAAPGTTYGLGTGISPTGCEGTGYGHLGGGAAYTTGVLVSPDGRRVAVVLANGRDDGGRSDRAVAKAVNRLFCAA